MQEETFDLVVLDVMLPDVDGFEVARRLRADGIDTPILFLTARTALDDKAQGFGARCRRLRDQAVLAGRDRDAGAGDPAPFGGGRDGAGSEHELRFADVVMDADAHQVWRAGEPIQLTATEFRLLRLFLMNPGRVLSKSQILDHVWHYDFDGDSNVLETYISYLRRKLNEHGTPLIHTVRLVGYVLRDEPGE